MNKTYKSSWSIAQKVFIYQCPCCEWQCQKFSLHHLYRYSSLNESHCSSFVSPPQNWESNQLETLSSNLVPGLHQFLPRERCVMHSAVMRKGQVIRLLDRVFSWNPKLQSHLLLTTLIEFWLLILPLCLWPSFWRTKQFILSFSFWKLII